METLQKYSPIALILVLGVNVYLIVMVDKIHDTSRNASHSAHNAANAALNAQAKLGQLSAIESKLQLLTLQCSSRRTASGGLAGDAMFRSFNHFVGFSMGYHEVLLEDMALKARVDLKKARDTIVDRFKKHGYGVPRKWQWVRKP